MNINVGFLKVEKIRVGIYCLAAELSWIIGSLKKIKDTVGYFEKHIREVTGNQFRSPIKGTCGADLSVICVTSCSSLSSVRCRSSHSHTTTTFQPAAASAACLRASRSMFA